MDATPTIPPGKVYRSVWAPTFLGGPLAAGYVMAENFKTFDEPVKARWAMIIAVLTGIAIFSLIFLIPNIEKLPGPVIPTIYTAVAAGLWQHYQGARIESHIKAGGAVHKGWRALAVVVVSLVATLVPMFGVAYATGAFEDPNAAVRTYGTLQHELAYDRSNMSAEEVEEAGHALEFTGFFGGDQKNYIHVRIIHAAWEFTIAVVPGTDVQDPAALAPYEEFRKDLAALLPDKKIVLNLVVEDLDNVVKRFE